MPGGGHLVTASVDAGQTHLNNEGDVVFNGILDTDVTGSGTKDTGLFQWSHGHLSLIARTGTVLPGVGTVKNLVMGVIVTPPPPTLVPNSSAVNNDRGQVLFGATLTDGRGVLLLDTPEQDQEGEQGEGEHRKGRHEGAAQASTDETALDSASLVRTLEVRFAHVLPGPFLASNVANPSAGENTSLTVQPVSIAGPLSAPSVGGDNPSPLPSAPQRLTASAGALTERAVDALFADLGDAFADGAF
jgi:hypothetical protein